MAAIASAPGSIRQRAEAFLEPLRRLVPFQAATILLLDREHHARQSLVCHGYDDATRSYMDSPVHQAEIEQLALHRPGPPMCVRDLPVPPAEVRSWAEYLEPAGFREGLVTRLFTADGRYLGVLGLSTESVEHPTDAARDLIGVLSRTIAHAVDPMRTIAAAARTVADAVAGIVLTRDGAPLPLPGLPDNPLLAAGSAVLTAAAAILAHGIHAQFLCPRQGGTNAGHVRVTALACPPESPAHLVAIVLLSPPRNLHTLTRRELQVLGLIVEGWPNQRIAATLLVTESTVATHVEHILIKLGVASRVLAARRALLEGLYVPLTLSQRSPA